jgi:mono/diheme cytochrome c family protein
MEGNSMKWKRIGLFGVSALFLIGLAKIQVMAHSWMAPKEAAEIKNPIVLDAESARKGKEAYLDLCAACHGDNLEGLKAEEAGLDIDTPNLKQRLKTHTDGDFFWKINEGRGEMPSFKDELSDDEKWQIIYYIRQEAE